MLRLAALLSCILLSSTLRGQNEEVHAAISTLILDGNYKEALISVNNALQQTPTSVKLLVAKADVLVRLGQFEQATEILRNIIPVTDLDAARIANSQGSLLLNQGKYDGALQEFQKAIDLFNKANAGSTIEATHAIANLGNLYMSTGKYIQADEQLQMALRTRLAYLPETHELIAASYNDLGLVYTQLDVNKAFEFYEKALTIYEQLHGEGDHPKLAIANTNLGVLNRSEKFYGDAVNHFETALKIWNKIYPQPHPNKALVLMNLGQTYSGMGDQKAALEFYEKAKTMYEESQGKKHPDVAYIYNLLGNEKLAQEKYDAALMEYQKALIANIPSFNSENVWHNPKAQNFYSGNQLLYSLMYKAQALETRYYGRTLKDGDLAFGIQTLLVADSLIDKLRQQTTNESDKIILGAIANEVYSDGVRMAFTLSEVALKDRRKWKELSFYFAEKSKSAVLLEAISDTDAKEFANIPKSLLEEEKNLKSSIALLAQKIAQGPTADEEKYLRQTLFELNRSYEAFTHQLETSYPEYFNLKFNSATPGISQLQQLLPVGTALLSYFIDEKKSRLYVFTISKTKFSITENALPADYDKLLTGLRNSLYFMEINSYKKAATDLYKLLLPKNIPHAVNDLVILPAGRMSVIPFETLLSKSTKRDNYRNLPYLLKDYSIRYEFSAGLVLQKKKSGEAGSITSALLCAPVTFPEKDNLYELPGTEAEVNTIANLLQEKNISRKIYLNKDANETSIKSGELKSYSFIHFATHGIVDETNPELSRIFLQTDSEAEDGNLYAGEIYNLEFDAQLVALSACETGMGKISKGEGVIGLSRALVYAGAKNIIVSFWSVSDESTAKLMTTFYQKMLERPSAQFSKDLREAKLRLLNENYSAPYFWAPFILIGF